ncbi:MAG: cytochrome c [Myxococcota bacterium]|nr:cytochrome c [Myxococcota bacterium]
MRAAGLFVACFVVANSGQQAWAAEPDVLEDYTLHCSACHTLDGGGTKGFVPSLRELGPLLDHPEGRNYLIRVPGVAQAPLSDARIARLLNWVLAEYSKTAVEPPFGQDEVADWRAHPLRDPVGFRAQMNTELEASTTAR